MVRSSGLTVEAVPLPCGAGFGRAGSPGLWAPAAVVAAPVEVEVLGPADPTTTVFRSIAPVPPVFPRPGVDESPEPVEPVVPPIVLPPMPEPIPALPAPGRDIPAVLVPVPIPDPVPVPMPDPVLDPVP